MGKEVRSQGLVGSTRKGFPLWYKIDFFGSMILLTNIYIISLLFASASTNYLYLSIPNELLVHGPIILNVSKPELRVKPIVCNPHFKLFRENYLTESLKNQEEAKSESYLAVPEVSALLTDINSAQNRTETIFGMSANGLCEMIPPANDWGDCITLTEYKEQCLESECGSDASFCFWDGSSIVTLCAYVQIFTYITAVLLTFGLMFDPPPANFHRLVSPTSCAVAYVASAIFAITGLLTCVIGVSRYASAAMYDTYSEFYVSYDAAWQCFLFTSLCSVLFSACYIYLACFTPKYPRQVNKWDLRRKNFERTLAHIKDKVVEEV